MAGSRTNFTTPVGRLVAGSLYKPSTTDAEGRPLVVKSGTTAGQPRVDYYFALAIPKGAEAQHGAFGWMATEWGAKIRAAGEAFLAHAAQLPGFAWKVKDGDSTVPNKRGKRPCDQEGHKGHWIVSFSSGFAPKVYTLIGQKEPQLVAQVDAVNLGDYVQVNGDVDGNNSQSQPGVYVNHGMVCLVGYGERIVVGPDVASAGFGAAALPPGASATPPAGFAPPVAAVPPVMPAVPPVMPPAAPPMPAAVPPAATVAPIVPNPAFLQVPGAPLPPVPAAPPAAPARVMLPPANGATYEQLIAAGWTDATLVQHGLMRAA